MGELSHLKIVYYLPTPVFKTKLNFSLKKKCTFAQSTFCLVPSADMRLDEHRKALCIIYSDGSIFWMPQAVYRSSCNIDVYAFPFDVQNCSLKFGSWTYDGFKLDVRFYHKKDFIDLTEYVESNAWKIIDVPAVRTEAWYTCCTAPFVDLKYFLVFQRRATLYNYILILPCILLTSITLILFWIPPESPAKMQLGEG